MDRLNIRQYPHLLTIAPGEECSGGALGDAACAAGERNRSVPVCPLLIRPAVAADADPIASVFLAARRAGMPWLPLLHSGAATRW
jgi:hypothetical protein